MDRSSGESSNSGEKCKDEYALYEEEMQRQERPDTRLFHDDDLKPAIENVLTRFGQKHISHRNATLMILDLCHSFAETMMFYKEIDEDAEVPWLPFLPSNKTDKNPFEK
jgi:hypothetical protein